jgi:hypothetical protein
MFASGKRRRCRNNNRQQKHELGHLFGPDHEADGLMAETLTAGTRLEPWGAAPWAGLTAGL